MLLRFTLFFALALTLQAQTPDLKRNQKVQRLASQTMKAQAAYGAEMKAWMGECSAKGLTLQPVAGNLMDCVPQQPVAPPQPPRAAPVKPEAK